MISFRKGFIAGLLHWIAMAVASCSKLYLIMWQLSLIVCMCMQVETHATMDACVHFILLGFNLWQR